MASRTSPQSPQGSIETALKSQGKTAENQSTPKAGNSALRGAGNHQTYASTRTVYWHIDTVLDSLPTHPHRSKVIRPHNPHQMKHLSQNTYTVNQAN